MTDESNLFGVGQFGEQFGSGAPTDVKTLINDVLRQTGVNVDSTDYRETCLSFMNQVYTSALKGRHWKFLNKELSIEIPAPTSTGSVSLVQGSHTVEEYTAAGDPPVVSWNSRHDGALFIVRGDAYRIDKVENGKKLTLANGYSGETENVSYEIIHDRVRLDAKVQDIKSLTPIGSSEMKPLGLQEFRTLKSRNPDITGIPTHYTIVGFDAQAGQISVEVYPSPDKLYTFHLEYNERITRLEDSDTCFATIPPDHMDVLILGTRERIYEDQNNLSLAGKVGSDARIAWNRMAGDQSLTDSRARFQMGRNYLRRASKRDFGRGFYGTKYFGRFD